MKPYIHIVGLVLLFCSSVPADDLAITNVSADSGSVLLEWNMTASRYIVQTSTSLLAHSWQHVDPVLAVHSSVFSNHMGVAFFRIREVTIVNFSDPVLDSEVRDRVGGSKHLPVHELYDIDVNWIPSLTLEDGVTNLDGIGWLARLQILDMEDNLPSISDLTPLAGLSDLAELSLEGNGIAALDLAPLEGLTQLRSLDLGRNNITNLSDVTGLTNLTHLTELELDRNEISSIVLLNGMTNLRVLRLWRNHIEDLTPLSIHTNLTRLDLDENNINDLSPLITNAVHGGLGPGDLLELQGNPLSLFAQTNQIPRLRDQYGVDVRWP